MKRRITELEIILFVVIALLMGISIKFVLRAGRLGVELVNTTSGREEQIEKAWINGGKNE